MAHFAVIINEQGWLVDATRLESDTQLLITGAGHTYESWRPETAEIKLNQFLNCALSRKMPVAIIYMGHGYDDGSGWAYASRKKLSYLDLAKSIATLRVGQPTAVINDCCFASSIGLWFEKTSFDRDNTIALTAGVATRPSSSGERLESRHTYRVLDTWFNKRNPFDPFDWENNVIDLGDEEKNSWQHWMRQGPERFGSEKIDQYFIVS